MFRKYKWLTGLLIATCFFFLNIPLISNYGLNWDEPAHYIRGQAFVRFFLSGKTDYKDLPTIQTHLPKSTFVGKKHVDYKDDSVFRRSIYQADEREGGTQTFSYYASQPTGHPPLNGELASAFNLVFYQDLGIVGDIESYRLFTLFSSALLIFIVYIFAVELWGTFAGIVAVIVLITYPLFFAESHFNIKDPVSTSFYTATLYAFYKGITTKKTRWVIISSIAAGLALGTRVNILFAPIGVLIWLLFVYKRKGLMKFPPLFVLISIVLFLLIPITMFYASWPAFWENPLAAIFTMFTSLKNIGYTEQFQPNDYFIFGINTYPLQWLLFTTPLITLFLSTIGVVYSLRKGFSEKYSISLFLLFWFLFPILRVTIGGFSIYGGLRQIMEFVPAMAMLSGIGAYYLVTILNNFLVKYFKRLNWSFQPFLLLQLIIVLSFLPIVFKLISIHPNENAYFNPLIGGLKGAEEKNFPDWGVTLGSAYQQGINWLNENAEKEANLTIVRGLHSNIPRIKLRQDINFDNKYYSGVQKKGEYIMEVIDYNWNNHGLGERRNYLAKLKSVYAVKVDDVAILKVWKNEEKYINKVTIVAVGDIACGPESKDDCKEWETSELVRSINPDVVLALGDLQYEEGEYSYFLGENAYCHSNPPRCFDPTWGRFKDKMFPVTGNHEYFSPILRATGYFDYFNGIGNYSGRAGDRDKGYYSFDRGTWHFIALNTNCVHIGGCGKNSPQFAWLVNDLAKNNKKCTLAFWHEPRFLEFWDIWKVLYDAGTDLVLAASDHNYNRLYRSPFLERPYEKGKMLEFVVGTGGKRLEKNSGVKNDIVYGILKLILGEDKFNWDFVPIKGQTFTDSGSGYCL